MKKKAISLLLSIILIFAFAAPSFAMGAEDTNPLEAALVIQPRAVELYICGSAVNLRTGPGTSYSQVVSGVTFNYGNYVVDVYNSAYGGSIAYDGSGNLWRYVKGASGPLSGYTGWVLNTYVASNNV